MKKEEHKERLSLTLVFSVMVFCVIFFAAAFAVGFLYLMAELELIHIANERFSVNNVILFMAIISTILGFLIAFISSKFSLRPVNRFINQFNRLAQGDFKARLHLKKPFSSIRVFQETEKSFNRAAQELENTEMLRSDFINNFSHEFKTPIVSIAGFAKLLRHGGLTQEQQAEYLAIIEEEALRLSYMATNVLSLTRVENQTILTDVSAFNLSEQIRGAVLLLVDQWTPKELDMELSFGEHTIHANEELLKQVWINLLDNAIKFSSPGGRVSVTLSEGPQRLQVAVTNQGRDIPEECQERIFQKFYQVDESHGAEGNGIGLAIVKKVVQLHSGEVTVISQNGSTTFTVTLPK